MYKTKLRKKYYYLISSLPELRFGDKLPFTMEEFFNEYSSEIEKDVDLVNIIILKYDIKNLELIFKNKAKDDNIKRPSIYTIEELQQNIKTRENLPDFIITFLNNYETNSEYLENFNELEKGYLVYGYESDNTFLKAYFKFELDFRNAIASMRARTQDIDVLKYTVGDEDDIVISKIKKNKSLPDFGISNEAIWIDKLIQAFDKDDPLNLENTLDRIRFEQIEILTSLMDFQVEKLLGYLLQLSIMERWAEFDKETGSNFTKNIVKDVIEP